LGLAGENGVFAARLLIAVMNDEDFHGICRKGKTAR